MDPKKSQGILFTRLSDNRNTDAKIQKQTKKSLDIFIKYFLHGIHLANGICLASEQN